MLKLVQTFGAHAGRTKELDQEVVRIGRLPTCDFAFDPHADLDASGLHAEIRKEAGQYVLVDAGSRNGTLVGGRTIQRHVLADGDEIEFGTGGPRVRVQFLGSARSAPPQRTPMATGPSTPMDLGPISADGPTGFIAPNANPVSVRPAAFDPRMASPTGAPPPMTAPPPPGPGSMAPAGASAAEVARVVEERMRPLVMAVALMGVLLIVTMCGLTGVLLFLVTRS